MLHQMQRAKGEETEKERSGEAAAGNLLIRGELFTRTREIG